ncbi:hypothetical protein K504DRAFT_493488 [Pleomassaria siparia CBS 279.74]|uniref:Uncharacterized protein n=1 Tax=Pleomassaria siparia CBS 279.74 TaxID=1314801 RepID=A0A6G1K1U3_9PLEO|nr:hypothetical protein K504DRAFT_493488 [Pleomassaria siparia CBS 279.74]
MDAMNASTEQVITATINQGHGVLSSNAVDNPTSKLLNRGSQHVSDRYGSGRVFAQCHRFLENVKSHFGEFSRQSVTIHDTLGQFRAGKIPKRDVYQTIYGELGNCTRLVHDLEDILNPQDAFMDASGFRRQVSSPPTPVQQDFTELPLQHFLQPQHWPYLRMPDISLWGPNQRLHLAMQSSIDPQLLRAPLVHRNVPSAFQQIYQHQISDSYEDDIPHQPTYIQKDLENMYREYIASRIPSSPAATRTPMSLAGCKKHTSPASPPYGVFGYEMQHSSPIRDVNPRPRTPYAIDEARERDRFEDTWVTQSERELVAGRRNNPTPHQNTQTIAPTCLQHHGYSKANPYVLGTPIAVPLGQPTPPDMMPSEMSHRRSVSQTYPNHNEDGEYENGTFAPRPLAPAPASAPIIMQQPAHDLNQQLPARRPSVIAPRTYYHFVHSICGKSYSSRYNVKKHHWGTVVDDLDTVTGCWAKNGKPDVQWDEHPTCRDQRSARSRSTKTHKLETAHPEFKAPVAPAMVPENTLAGFPILSETPQTVAETLKRSPSVLKSPQMEIIPYHTSRLPIRSGIDTLLMAVNVAVKIDAPTPQGRNDSVVSHLDAQAAVDEERQYRPIPPHEASHTHSHVPYSYRVPPSRSDMELGMTQSVHCPIAMHEDMSSETKDESMKAYRASRSSISKRELKMLGLENVPGPTKKKLRIVGL